jgi:hypothetical protein
MMLRYVRKRGARRLVAIAAHEGLDLDDGGEVKHKGRRQRNLGARK